MRGTTLILQSLPSKHLQITVCIRKKLVQKDESDLLIQIRFGSLFQQQRDTLNNAHTAFHQPAAL